MLTLVRHADQSGAAWPGFGTLCLETRIGRTKLIESLAELEARGLFARQAQTRGKGLGSNCYRLPIEPPTEGLDGARRLVRQANQCAKRTSPLNEPGSSGSDLPIVRQANGASSPGEPYLLRDLPSRTPQRTGEPRERANGHSSPKGLQKAETPLPADWEPADTHREFARKHGLDITLEAIGFRGHFDGRSARSWNGRFTTWLSNQAKWDRKRPNRAPVQRGGTIREGDRTWIDQAAAAAVESPE